MGSFRLTVRAETWAGGELGHVHDLRRELLSGLPVNTSFDYAKWSPATKGNITLSVAVGPEIDVIRGGERRREEFRGIGIFSKVRPPLESE